MHLEISLLFSTVCSTSLFFPQASVTGKSQWVSVSFRIRPGQAGLSYVSVFQGFTTFGCSMESEIWDESFFCIFFLCHWDTEQKASACHKLTDALSNTQWRFFQQTARRRRLQWEQERAGCLSAKFGRLGFTSAPQPIRTSLICFISIPCPVLRDV